MQCRTTLYEASQWSRSPVSCIRRMLTKESVLYMDEFSVAKGEIKAVGRDQTAVGFTMRFYFAERGTFTLVSYCR